MSFARFSSSNVYVYEHYQGFIECCGCWLLSGKEFEDWSSVELATPREAIEHLEKHKQAGHNIATSIEQIKERYDDLDAPIEKNETDPYVLARLRENLRKSYEAQDE